MTDTTGAVIGVDATYPAPSVTPGSISVHIVSSDVLLGGGGSSGVGFVETLWTDDSGAYFIRVDTGTAISWKDVSGNPVSAPAAGARPAAGTTAIADRTSYQATASGTGYSTGDLIDKYTILDPGTGVVIGSFWLNATASLKLGSAPPSGNLKVQASSANTTGSGASDSATLRVINASDDPVLAQLQTMASDTTPAVTVGICVIKTASFVRPGDGVTYTPGDQVNNNTTATSVTPLSFLASSANGGSGMVRKARVRKTGLLIGGATFRLHLWNVVPTIATAGDNSPMTNVTGIAGYQGAIDITVDRVFADGSVGGGGAHSGSEINYVCAVADNKLYGMLEATGAYVPTPSETFNIDLELLPNA